MLKLVCIVFALVGGTSSQAQNIWTDLDLPRCPNYQRVCTDPVNEDLYFAGFHSTNNQCGLFSCDIYRRRAGEWDSLSTIVGTVRDMIVWQDTLIVHGGFLTDPPTKMVYFANGQLQPYDELPGVYRLRIIEDTLWAVGSFTNVNGQAASGVAKRVGGHWEPAGTMSTEYEFTFYDIIKYQGELILVGIGYMVNGGSGIYHLVNGVWELLGTGLFGLISTPAIMCIYQDVLYIGGGILQAEGNVGHGLIAWNGIEYLNVGGGLLWSPNDFSTLTGIRALEVRDGLLYCGGGFPYAGDLLVQGLVTWDGTRWCNVPGDFLGPVSGFYVNDMAFTSDSLYVACGPEVDGLSVDRAVAAAVADLAGDCQDTSVPDRGEETLQLVLLPNPASDQLIIKVDRPVQASIYNALGRVVWNGRASTRTAVDVSSWSPGLYTVRHSTGAALFMVAR